MDLIEHCDCGMPHLGGTEHADECPAGVYVPGHGLTGDAGEVERLRHQLAGAVRARELAQALVDLADENTNIKGVHEVAAEIVKLLTPAGGSRP